MSHHNKWKTTRTTSTILASRNIFSFIVISLTANLSANTSLSREPTQLLLMKHLEPTEMDCKSRSESGQLLRWVGRKSPDQLVPRHCK